MTKEEIRQYLKERNIPITSLEANSIIEGIKLADKTHGKELMYAIQKTHERTKREVINKACEWLENNMYYHNCGNYDVLAACCSHIIEEVIEKFKKAMGE